MRILSGPAVYCRDVVRRHDLDRYRLTLSQRPDRHAALFALFAFNHEIAKTREVVSDPTLGLIRLQWWRDAIGKVFAGDVLQHEVLQALAPVVATFGTDSQDFFIALINARERDLENVALPSLGALEEYAETTSSPLNRLALRLLAQPEPDVGAVSTAYAMTGLLRVQPLLMERAFFPHGVSAADTARRAGALLAGTGKLRGFLKANAAMTNLYLCRMEKLGYRLDDARLNLPPTGFSLAAIAGRFR